MKHEIETCTVLRLELTREEADYLHGIMQNPGYGVTPSEEPESERQIREKFFRATDLFKPDRSYRTTF